ncbi:MAG TPA: phosphate acyltransferase [Prolixibacteraceae bacterium]|jgi:phosphate butyryltransferase
MMLKRLINLPELVQSLDKKTLIAVNAVDVHSLEAIVDAVKIGLVKAIVTGDRVEILKQCEMHGIDPLLFEIVQADTVEESASLAVSLVKSVSGGILMKGLISSDLFMRAILHKEVGLLPPGGVLSHVSIVDNPNYHKLLIVSDVAVIPYPTIRQKIAMVHYLREMALLLGIPSPKIALIAPTEKVHPSMVSCTDAVEIMKVAEDGQFKPAIVYGPMALDVALDIESAHIKNIASEVAGDADCLLFPNIDAGNVFYKVNAKLCNASMAALVMGAMVPVILSSRGDSMQTKLNSIALAALLSK